MEHLGKGLQILYDYKNQLMQDILTSETLVKLLDDDLPMEQAETLAYKQVYPYDYVPETIEYGHSYICFDVDVQAIVNKTFLSPTISIWVFTHKSKLRLPTGGVRPDRIVSELVELLNGSRYYGLGELDLRSVKRFAPMTDFIGKYLVFDAKDYNRLSPSSKPIPSNRKSG